MKIKTDLHSLKKQYPYLELKEGSSKSDWALGAANIRKLLRRKFPSTKFKVVSDSFSMGDSIDISWTDGPTTEEVDAITRDFQEGSFNGMEDIYEYESKPMADLFGGAKYVQTSRRVSDENYLKTAEKFGYYDITRNKYGDFVDKDGQNLGYEVREMIQRKTWQTNFEEKPEPVAIVVESGSYKMSEHTHTKRNRQMFICEPLQRVSKEAFYTELGRAKGLGGWYSRAWGNCPGGFAFWDKEKAEAFCGDSKPLPPDDGERVGNTAKTPVNDHKERLNGLAERMLEQVETMRLPMSQNPTPKRNREYSAKQIEADNIERAANLLLAIAAIDEPEGYLRGYMTKKAALEVTRTRVDTSRGYYTILDTGEFSDMSENAKKARELLNTPSEEQKKARKVAEMERDLIMTNISGFFQTPKAVAEKMVAFADIQDGHTVLEPSAGAGNIADLIPGCDCIEVNYTLRELLTLKGHKLVASDFLDFSGSYDRILMNPPFERLQDTEHVKHAYSLLNEGGRLVAIVGASYSFNSTGKAVEFREWLGDKLEHSEVLESGTFKGNGLATQTGVTSHLLVLTK